MPYTTEILNIDVDFVPFCLHVGNLYPPPPASPSLLQAFRLWSGGEKLTRQKTSLLSPRFFSFVAPAYDLARSPPSELLFERLEQATSRHPSLVSVSPDQL